MFSNPRLEEAEAAVRVGDPIPPEPLYTLTELVAESGLVYGDNANQLASRLGDEVVADDLGRRCVPRSTALRLIEERREREERIREEQRRRVEEAAASAPPIPRGIAFDPTSMSENMTALAVMMGHDRS